MVICFGETNQELGVMVTCLGDANKGWGVIVSLIPHCQTSSMAICVTHTTLSQIRGNTWGDVPE